MIVHCSSVSSCRFIMSTSLAYTRSIGKMRCFQTEPNQKDYEPYICHNRSTKISRIKNVTSSINKRSMQSLGLLTENASQIKSAVSWRFFENKTAFLDCRSYNVLVGSSQFVVKVELISELSELENWEVKTLDYNAEDCHGLRPGNDIRIYALLCFLWL